MVATAPLALLANFIHLPHSLVLSSWDWTHKELHVHAVLRILTGRTRVLVIGVAALLVTGVVTLQFTQARRAYSQTTSFSHTRVYFISADEVAGTTRPPAPT